MWVESLKKKEETVHPEEVSIYFCFILTDNINVKIETKVIVKKSAKNVLKQAGYSAPINTAVLGFQNYPEIS